MKKLFILFALFLSVFLTGVMAQSPTGTIEGRITDQTGAAVAGATVSITEKATGRVITVTTNDEGYFEARSLPPGSYAVQVERQGFASAKIGNLTVQTGQVANADVSLKVGDVKEIVEIAAGETQLQVDTSRQTVDGVITGRQIINLPLNTRNALDLAELQPSVVVRDGGAIDPTKVNAYRTVGVNGASGTGTRVQVDGIDVTDETVGTTVANLSTDAVQEFQVSRSSFDLSTSLTTSGAVNIVTRSGSNEFHGSGFYFFQNQDIAARPQFLTAEAPFKRQQQGFRFAGPILKNKVFFFTNYESNYQTDQSIVTFGDFPALGGNTQIPIEFRYTTVKIDWAASDSMKLFYRHSYSDDLSTSPPASSPFQNVNWTNVHAVGADITGGRFTHSFRYGYVNFNNRIQSQEVAPFTFPKTPQGIPFNLSVGDYVIGPNALAPQQTYQDNNQFKYDGSFTFGDHTLRYGGEVNRIILGGFANFAGPLSAVGDITSPPAGQAGNPLAYPLVDFSTGPNTGFFTATPAHNLPYGGHKNTRYAWYVSDSWRIRSNLTINAGVRWNFESNFFSKGAPELPLLEVYGPGKGKVAEFPKDAFSPQFGFAWDPTGSGKTSIRGGFYLAYEMNIFNNSLFDEFSRIAPGIGPTIMFSDFVHDPFGNPINVLGIPGCAPTSTAAGDYTCLQGRPISTITQYLGQIHLAVQQAFTGFQYDPRRRPSEFENSLGVTFGGTFPGDFEIPYAMQFSIGFQRELFKGHVISVDYVRNRGVGLPFLLGEYENRRDARFFNETAARNSIATRIGTTPANVNPTTIQTYLNANPTATIATFSLANDTIFPGRTPNISRARLLAGGFSLYQGLQVLMNGRFSSEKTKFTSIGGHQLLGGVNYSIAYALARAEATSGSSRTEFINNPTNNANFNADFGPTGLDRTHILTATLNVDTIGGLRFDNIIRFRTAPPISLFVPDVDNLSAANGIFTTDINGDGNIGGTTPRADLLPGTQIGALGRSISSFAQLNAIIRNFNANFAGRLTPQGQRLVAAGIFSEAQLRALGAFIRPITEVPESNPWPFEKIFSVDMRITRPIRIKERYVIEPSLSIFNLFNNTPIANGGYAGLQPFNFGALNFPYTTAAQRASLTQDVRGRAIDTRSLQFGIRFTF
jgi:hypothetical protein